MVSLIGLEIYIFYYLRKNTIYYIIIKSPRKLVLKIYNPLVYESRWSTCPALRSGNGA